MGQDLVWGIVSDLQIPYQNDKYVELFFKVMDYIKPDVIDVLGDIDDLCELSRFSEGTLSEYNGNLKESSKLVQDFFGDLRSKTDGQILFAQGNHECFTTEDHRVITKSGWKHVFEISEGEQILSVDDNDLAVWVAVEKVHIYDDQQEIYNLNYRNVRGRFTPNHMFHYYPNYKSKNIVTSTAEQFVDSWGGVFVTAGGNEKEDFPISDEEIRLLAWCLTDSSYTSRRGDGGRWVFYQSEPKNERIEVLINSLGLDYTAKIRNRDIKEIAGKTLKTRPQPQHEYTVEGDHIRWGRECHYTMPDIVWKFSRRQVNVLIDEWAFTNGTIPTGQKSSIVIYCSDNDKRHQLMSLMVANGISCYETEYRPGHWRINARTGTRSKVEITHSTRQPPNIDVAKYGVACVTVPTGKFFIEHDGAIHLTGNSRLENYISKKAPGLKGLITPDSLWHLSKHGIETVPYEAPPLHRFGDIYVHHGPYAVKGAGNSIRKVLDEFGVSCLQGHTHSMAYVHKTYSLRNETLRGWEIGHMTDIYSSGMAYDRKHDWQAGFAVGIIENGEYPHIDLVSISPDNTCYVWGKKFSV